MKKLFLASIVMVLLASCSSRYVFLNVKEADINSNMCMVYYRSTSANSGEAIIEYGEPKYQDKQIAKYVLADRTFNSIIDVSSFLISKGWDFRESIYLTRESAHVAHFIFTFPGIRVTKDSKLKSDFANKADSQRVVTERVLDAVDNLNTMVNDAYSDLKSTPRYSSYKEIFKKVEDNINSENIDMILHVQRIMMELSNKELCDLDVSLSEEPDLQKKITLFMDYGNK